jgi:hypothetical protein
VTISHECRTASASRSSRALASPENKQRKERNENVWLGWEGVSGGGKPHPNPGAAVFELVHAWTSDEPEEDVGAAIFVLGARHLDAELVRVRPGGTTRRALLLRMLHEEPVVRAVPLVDF